MLNYDSHKLAMTHFIAQIRELQKDPDQGYNFQPIFNYSKLHPHLHHKKLSDTETLKCVS